ALLILAGLQIIPEDVYEAAKMDGATKWQRFTRITLPLVKPALLVAVLFRVLDVLRIFDLPYIPTGGANNPHTLSILVHNQIRQGFNSAAALSTITFVFIFLVAFVFVRVLGANVAQTQQSQQKGARWGGIDTHGAPRPGDRGHGAGQAQAGLPLGDGAQLRRHRPDRPLLPG